MVKQKVGNQQLKTTKLIFYTMVWQKNGWTLWWYGLLSFQGRNTKLETWPKLNIIKRNYFIFLNWHSGELSKETRFWLSKSMSKKEEFLFHLTILISDFFCKRRFLIHSIIFETLYTDAQFLTTRHNDYLWRYWFLATNISNFVSLPWKLDNPYYHGRSPLCPYSSYAPEMKIGEGSRLTYFAQPSRIHVDLASFPVWAWCPKNFANQKNHESLGCFLHETNN